MKQKKKKNAEEWNRKMNQHTYQVLYILIRNLSSFSSRRYLIAAKIVSTRLRNITAHNAKSWKKTAHNEEEKKSGGESAREMNEK